MMKHNEYTCNNVVQLGGVPKFQVKCSHSCLGRDPQSRNLESLLSAFEESQIYDMMWYIHVSSIKIRKSSSLLHERDIHNPLLSLSEIKGASIILSSCLAIVAVAELSLDMCLYYF